jgi:hypothetical protein
MCDLFVQILNNRDFCPEYFNEVSWSSSDDEQSSSHSSYHPRPKKRFNKNVKMEGKEQALQYWLNKDGKKCYSFATV